MQNFHDISPAVTFPFTNKQNTVQLYVGQIGYEPRGLIFVYICLYCIIGIMYNNNNGYVLTYTASICNVYVHKYMFGSVSAITFVFLFTK